VRATVSSSKSCSTSPFLFREETAELRCATVDRDVTVAIHQARDARTSAVSGFIEKWQDFLQSHGNPRRPLGLGNALSTPRRTWSTSRNNILCELAFNLYWKFFLRRTVSAKSYNLWLIYSFIECHLPVCLVSDTCQCHLCVSSASVTFACHLPDFAQKQLAAANEVLVYWRRRKDATGLFSDRNCFRHKDSLKRKQFWRIEKTRAAGATKPHTPPCGAASPSPACPGALDAGPDEEAAFHPWAFGPNL